ncbi:MAG: glycosyltransferase, partial [Chloroflexi bacterium]|nr:glycosyltransferase [Chloroflexota bacterium]
SIGDHALVGMGSVVLESVEANAVVAGNPARFLRVTVEPETNGAAPVVVEQESDGIVSDVADLEDASVARDPARLSVVLPVLNEEQNVVPAVEQMTRTLDAVGYDWDLVLVDDGSRDGTFAAMRACAAQDPRIRSIRLSRTYGSHVAITAGLAETSGEACVVMTPDPEEPPEMIPAFVQKWREGCDVVWGIRAKRHESIGMRFGSQLFHVLFRLFGVSEHSEPAVRGGFFLISRRVADALRDFKERNRTLVGLLSWLGFSQGLVEYSPDLRPGGRSKWTFTKRAKLAADSFVSVSYVPIRAVALLGISIALVSVGYALWMIAVALTRGGAAGQGSQALIAAVVFLGGLQLLASGMIGEYIWRALNEARGRPLYVIADRAGGSVEETAAVQLVAVGVGSNADGARP